MLDQQRDYSKPQTRSRAFSCGLLKIAPEDVVFAAKEYMTAELQQVSRT
jgi:hypothetical protein